ncbi:MAG TPA: amidohydrolase family protein [Candidatus Binatia bacterium]|nr:amidohydrolase family protein [Candidatus Binatia bacterium]
MRQFDIIDADGHVYERDAELFEYLEEPYAGRQTLLAFPFWPTIDGFQRGAIQARLNIHKSLATTAQIWLDFLDQAGLALTVLYPTAGLTCGFIRDPEWAVALTRAYNNWLCERYVKASPRLLGMALLPLQDPPEAVKELRRSVSELRMVGAVLPAAGLRRPLGHADFDPVYAEAERLGCALAVHGGPSQGLGLEVLEKFAQVHTLSHPFAQMLQVTSVIMSGVLDRFPRLRLAFLEAGVSWVPFLMDRMDRSYEIRQRAEYVGGVKRKPSTYVRSRNVFFSFDPGESTLSSVFKAIGTDTLLFASDFPHEVNLERCRREIATVEGWDEVTGEEKQKVLAENARRFYRLAR